MVGIQVGNEQEERKGEEGGFEKIKDFNVSGNAGEDSRGSGGGGRDDDVAFGGDGGRDDDVACGGGGGRDDDVACGGGGGRDDEVTFGAAPARWKGKKNASHEGRQRRHKLVIDVIRRGVYVSHEGRQYKHKLVTDVI